MQILYSFLFSVIPALIIFIAVRYLDKYEPEPVKKLLLHFGWGAFGATFLMILFSEAVSYLLENSFSFVLDNAFFSGLLAAPVFEELFKAMLLFFTYKSLEFDNLTDGIVYGAVIGAGFAMTENFLYFVNYSAVNKELIEVVFYRVIFSNLMHTVATAGFGGLLVLSKFSHKRHKSIYILSGFSLAVFLHFMWNLIVSQSFSEINAAIFLFTTLFFFALVLRISLKNEKDIIENELGDESVTDEVIGIILKPSKAKSKEGKIQDWNLLIKTGVKLAFRKSQIEYVDDEVKSDYNKEIITLRAKLQTIMMKIYGKKYETLDF